jgi:hypothetical protein
MFIGHFAVSFAAKRIAPTVSLGVLFLAAQLADLLWPNFVLLGVESLEIRPGATAVTPLEFVSYPYSHSLLSLALWALLAGVLYRAFGKSSAAAVTVGAVVISHWVLDAASHKPDMPLAFGDARVGLGLWYSIPATIAVEGVMFLVAVALYMRATRPRDRVGNVALWALVVSLVLIYLGNVLGPPPPSVPAVAWSAQAIWLLVLWAYWIDRHRHPHPVPGPGQTTPAGVPAASGE